MVVGMMEGWEAKRSVKEGEGTTPTLWACWNWKAGNERDDPLGNRGGYLARRTEREGRIGKAVVQRGQVHGREEQEVAMRIAGITQIS